MNYSISNSNSCIPTAAKVAAGLICEEDAK